MTYVVLWAVVDCICSVWCFRTALRKRLNGNSWLWLGLALGPLAVLLLLTRPDGPGQGPPPASREEAYERYLQEEKAFYARYWQSFNRMARFAGWLFLLFGLYGVLTMAVFLLAPQLLSAEYAQSMEDANMGVVELFVFALPCIFGILLLKVKPYFPDKNRH